MGDRAVPEATVTRGRGDGGVEPRASSRYVDIVVDDGMPAGSSSRIDVSYISVRVIENPRRT